MKEIRGKLTERVKRTKDVESFRFVLDENIDFLPGQFLQVIFDEHDKSNKLLNKYLSFSCAPGRDYIELTKKLSGSEFSNRLKDLKNGDSVLFKGPMGNVVFERGHDKIGFLVGGIGITPAISILEYIADKKISTDMCMLYSNWKQEDIAFKKELDVWSEENKKLRIIHTLVDCKPGDIGCFSGMINKEFMIEHMNDYVDRLLFVFGPPAMVTVMKDICSDLKISKEMLKAESFVGY